MLRFIITLIIIIIFPYCIKSSGECSRTFLSKANFKLFNERANHDNIQNDEALTYWSPSSPSADNKPCSSDDESLKFSSTDAVVVDNEDSGSVTIYIGVMNRSRISMTAYPNMSFIQAMIPKVQKTPRIPYPNRAPMKGNQPLQNEKEPPRKILARREKRFAVNG